MCVSRYKTCGQETGSWGGMRGDKEVCSAGTQSGHCSQTNTQDTYGAEARVPWRGGRPATGLGGSGWQAEGQQRWHGSTRESEKASRSPPGVQRAPCRAWPLVGSTEDTDAEAVRACMAKSQGPEVTLLPGVGPSVRGRGSIKRCQVFRSWTGLVRRLVFRFRRAGAERGGRAD